MCDYAKPQTGNQYDKLSCVVEGSIRLETAWYFFMVSLLRVGFFNRDETRADLKCERTEPSESDKLIIDVIGVITMSISH